MCLVSWPVPPCKEEKSVPARSGTCCSLPLEEDHRSFCFPTGNDLKLRVYGSSRLELGSYLEMHLLPFVF